MPRYATRPIPLFTVASARRGFAPDLVRRTVSDEPRTNDGLISRARRLGSHADLRHPPPPLARSVSQEEMYSYVTVADAPEGFSGLGTTVVDDV
jgi:hypothetical protein